MKTTIKQYFENSIIVAHNARFDLGVLHKCFNTYGIIPPNMNYMCTVDLSKKHIISINHKLNTLCQLWELILKIQRKLKISKDNTFYLYYL